MSSESLLHTPLTFHKTSPLGELKEEITEQTRWLLGILSSYVLGHWLWVSWILVFMSCPFFCMFLRYNGVQVSVVDEKVRHLPFSDGDSIFCRYLSKLQSLSMMRRCNPPPWYLSKSATLIQHLYIQHLLPLSTTSTLHWWVSWACLYMTLSCLNDDKLYWYSMNCILQAGNRVIMFSYGSGLTATMFSLRLNEGQHPFSLSNIAAVMNVAGKLESRHEV